MSNRKGVLNKSNNSKVLKMAMPPYNDSKMKLFRSLGTTTLT